MNIIKSGPVLAGIAFVVSLILFQLFFRGASNDQEFVMRFNRPLKIENPDLVAYTLDSIDGQEKDLTFRCNPQTGEGYFSLKSKNLSWASTHCQDMVGAVKDVEDKKKPFATVMITVVENKVLYQVQRNQ